MKSIKKRATGAMMGLAMSGAVKQGMSQDMAKANPDTQKQIEVTFQAKAEEADLKLEITKTPEERYNEAMTTLTKEGKTKEEREQITNSQELKALYIKQSTLYNQAKSAIKEIKGQGNTDPDTIKSMIAQLKPYGTGLMQSQIKTLEEKEETAREKEETAREKEETAREKEETALSESLNQWYRDQAKFGTTPAMIERLRNLSKEPGFRNIEGTSEETYKDIRNTLGMK